MSWTYSQDPTNSPKDAVRFLIGDTNAAQQLLQDEEIAWCLAEVNNEPYRASANACSNLAALFTGLAQSESKSVGGLDLSKSYGDRASRFKALSMELLARSRRVNTPMVNADPNALGSEIVVGGLDPYFLLANAWPSNSALGVSTTYGTGSTPDDTEPNSGWTVDSDL